MLRKLENVGGLSFDDRPDEAVEQGGYLRMLPKVTLLVGSDSILLVTKHKKKQQHTCRYTGHHNYNKPLKREQIGCIGFRYSVGLQQEYSVESRDETVDSDTT